MIPESSTGLKKVIFMKKLLPITLLVLIFSGISASAQNWSTYGGNIGRTGNSEITGPSSVATPAWQITNAAYTLLGENVYTFGDRFVTSRVSAGFAHVVIECRNLQDGSLVWTSPFISASSKLYCMGFSEDAVYACDYSTDSVYAMNTADGSIKWRGEVRSYSYGARESVVYACNGDIILNGPVASANSTVRLNKDDGRVVWTNNNLYAVSPVVPLAATGTRVYRITGAISQPIRLTAIDIETGATLYQTDGLAGDGDQESPMVTGNDGRIYFWRDNGALWSFTDTGSGFTENWSYPSMTPPVGGNNGSLAVGIHNDIYGFDGGKVIRIRHDDGSLRNQSQVGIEGGNITIGADSTVYVSDQGGTVYAFSADLQQVIWQFNVPSNVFGNPVLAKDGFMVFTPSGTTIKAFKPDITRKPVADFRVSSRKTATGQPVNFFDQSSFAPTAWEWSFPGAVIPSSTEPNPSGITYTTPGIYEVTLVASNASGTDTLVKSCYIEVILNTGSDELQANEPVSVYPNPFARQLTFSVIAGMIGTPYQVVSLQGKVVADGTFTMLQQTVPLDQLVNGLYFLKAGNLVYKLVKQD